MYMIYYEEEAKEVRSCFSSSTRPKAMLQQYVSILEIPVFIRNAENSAVNRSSLGFFLLYIIVKEGHVLYQVYGSILFCPFTILNLESLDICFSKSNIYLLREVTDLI